MSRLGDLFGVDTSASKDYASDDSGSRGFSPRQRSPSNSDSDEEDDFNFLKKGQASRKPSQSAPSSKGSGLGGPQDSLKYVPPKEPTKKGKKKKNKKKQQTTEEQEQTGTQTSPASAPPTSQPTSQPTQPAQPPQHTQPAIVFSTTIYLFKDSSNNGSFQPHPSSTKLGLVILSSTNGISLLIYDAKKTPIVQAPLPKFKLLSVGYYTFEAGGITYSLTFEQSLPAAPNSSEELVNYLAQVRRCLGANATKLRTRLFE